MGKIFTGLIELCSFDWPVTKYLNQVGASWTCREIKITFILSCVWAVTFCGKLRLDKRSLADSELKLIDISLYKFNIYFRQCGS